VVEKDSGAAGRRIEITGTLDPHEVEAIRLELRRLATRYGIQIESLDVERPAQDALRGPG